MLKRSSGIELPKDHPRFIDVELDLNRLVRGWDDHVTRMKFYEEKKNKILIPRFYPIKELIKDNVDIGEDILIESNITPRNERQKKSIEFLVNNKEGILQLEPGTGKTVVSIATISIIKKKTIIFVHKDKLLEQWKKEIIDHTSLTEEDISRLSITTYEDDLKKPIILSTVQTVLSGIHSKTKSSLFIKALKNSGIGQMFLDECHTTVGPEKFSQVSLLMKCARVHGLSATPCRSDGNDDIIKWHLGEVTYFSPGKEELLSPKIYQIYFPFGIYSKFKGYLSWGGKFHLSRYHKQMIKSEKYIRTVSKTIKRLYDEKRTILVLGTRVNVLLELSRKSHIPNYDIGIFIPGSTKKERLSVSDTDCLDEAFQNKRVVFSTYAAARDGNNRPSLDCLVMSTPTTNVEQATGRICRVLEGKKNPIVVDFIDVEGPSVNIKDGGKANWFVRNALIRRAKYVEKNWDIKTIKLNV